MRKAKELLGRLCPKCGASDKQYKGGYQQSGAARCVCKHCNCKYNLSPKGKGYSEEIRKIAIREYYSGLSARAVGKIHNMSKANVLNWIKKTGYGVDKSDNEI